MKSAEAWPRSVDLSSDRGPKPRWRAPWLAGAPWAAAVWASVCLLLVSVSVAFVDRPFARMMHDLFRDGPAAAALAELPQTGILVPLLVISTVVVCLIAGMRPAVVVRIGFTALVSFAISEAIKTSLKIAFGRTWPETWVHRNPSYIHDGVYGFFPFHGGDGYASFPSGHMTAAAAVMTVAWLMLPRGRVAWAVVMGLSAAGLLAMNYHFVSDVIAGFFLGSGVAVLIVRLMRQLMTRVAEATGTDRAP